MTNLEILGAIAALLNQHDAGRHLNPYDLKRAEQALEYLRNVLDVEKS